METKQSLPFSTQDAVLAQCLYSAGVPEAWNPTNIYDEAILKRLGYRGLTLEDAGKLAVKKEQRGEVRYWFQRTPELPLLLKAYEEQQSKIKDESVKTDVATALTEIIRAAADGDEKGLKMDEREAVLRITVIGLKTRPDFVSRWKQEGAMLRIPEAGQPVALGNGATSYPGFKLIPVDASEELKRKMKI